MGNLSIQNHSIGRWEISALAVEGATAIAAFPIMGTIVNSVPGPRTGNQRLAEWKIAIAVATKTARGPSRWDPRWMYTITVGFAFHAPTHGNKPSDVENFVKPCMDALAAGLFSLDEIDARTIKQFNYDDSNFVRLFIQRLPDVPSKEEEGIALYVSATE